MFRRFKRDQEIKCPIVVLDLHTTSPQTEIAEPVQETPERRASLFERANRIYTRSQRPVRRRSAGII
jgi:hypothetical protein